MVDTVPLGAGLSSSAALECATALAVDDLNGLGLGDSPDGRRELARACVRAENEVVGAMTGGMDQAASLLAEEGHALLIDTRDGSTRQVPFAPADDGLRLLVIDTKVRHHLADGQYGQRRASVEKAAEVLGLHSLREATERDLQRLEGELLRRARHIVTEIARVREVVALLDEGRLRDIGPLLDASHASLAHDYEVSCRELDLACEIARASGAFGARMTGGGFGGSAIALVPFSRVDDVVRSVRNAFAAEGHRDPGHHGGGPLGRCGSRFLEPPHIPPVHPAEHVPAEAEPRPEVARSQPPHHEHDDGGPGRGTGQPQHEAVTAAAAASTISAS